MSLRDRACAAVLDPSGSRILMVRHRHDGREYWTLPGGGQEDRETLAETAAREVKEETGLEVEIGERIVDETYEHEGRPALSRCFWGRLTGGATPVLGSDPEQANRDRAEQMLQEVAWRPLGEVQTDTQVSRVLASLQAPYFRVHTSDIAYATQHPRGLFVAVGKLVDAKTMTDEEIAAYWENRTWFEKHLPVPPFYADGNQIKAVTWFKNNPSGNAMFERMGFYRRMAALYGVSLTRTNAMRAPGRVVYEDEFQIGVVDSAHSGEGFWEEPIV